MQKQVEGLEKLSLMLIIIFKVEQRQMYKKYNNQTKLSLYFYIIEKYNTMGSTCCKDQQDTSTQVRKSLQTKPHKKQEQSQKSNPSLMLNSKTFLKKSRKLDQQQRKQIQQYKHFKIQQSLVLKQKIQQSQMLNSSSKMLPIQVQFQQLRMQLIQAQYKQFQKKSAFDQYQELKKLQIQVQYQQDQQKTIQMKKQQLKNLRMHVQCLEKKFIQIKNQKPSKLQIQMLKQSSKIIYQKNYNQKNLGICYAIAISTALRFSRRFFGFYPVQTHQYFVRLIVHKFGINGAAIIPVLEWLKERDTLLNYKKVNTDEATECLKRKQGLIYEMEMPQTLQEQIQKYPEKSHRFTTKYKGIRHACVITSQNNRAFKVKNSWGLNFGKQGYFWLSKKSIDPIFYVIYYEGQGLNWKIPTDPSQLGRREDFQNISLIH